MKVVMQHLKSALKRSFSVLINSGLNLKKLYLSILSLPAFMRDYSKFVSLRDCVFKTVKLFPCLSDRFESGGEARGHYFYQDLFVASKIFKNRPEKHVDIGSRIDGFVAHVAAFREIEVFDIRPTKDIVDNIVFRKADFMATLPNEFCNYCDSVSSLHALEHFGLGRYGDPVMRNGFLKGIENIHKILKSGGKAYISVPIGDHRVEFNAHRVFGLKYFLDALEQYFFLLSFSYVNDEGKLFKEVELSYEMLENSCHCFYGCGIFELGKK